MDDEWSQGRDGFLNVDLEVISPVAPDALVRALNLGALLLARHEVPEGWFVSFEVDEAGEEDRAQVNTAAFCDLLEPLDAEAREVWARSRSRVFDYGFRAGGGGLLKVRIEPETLRRVVALGATVAWSVYPEWR